MVGYAAIQKSAYIFISTYLIKIDTIILLLLILLIGPTNFWFNRVLLRDFSVNQFF